MTEVAVEVPNLPEPFADAFRRAKVPPFSCGVLYALAEREGRVPYDRGAVRRLVANAPKALRMRGSFAQGYLCAVEAIRRNRTTDFAVGVSPEAFLEEVCDPAVRQALVYGSLAHGFAEAEMDPEDAECAAVAVAEGGEGKPIFVTGDGMPHQEWVHARDAAFDEGRAGVRVVGQVHSRALARRDVDAVMREHKGFGAALACVELLVGGGPGPQEQRALAEAMVRVGWRVVLCGWEDPEVCSLSLVTPSRLLGGVGVSTG